MRRGTYGMRDAICVVKGEHDVGSYENDSIR
jgi:hypothetical protein